MDRSVAVTGLSVITPIGDTPGKLLKSMLAGKSALRYRKKIESDIKLGGVVGDLDDDDLKERLSDIRDRLPKEDGKRFRKLVRRAPMATKYAVAVAAEAWRDAGFYEEPLPDRSTNAAVVFGGHNVAPRYIRTNYHDYVVDPIEIDPLYALHALDTDVAASVGEALAVRGMLSTVGGACASGNIALRMAQSEIRTGTAKVAVVVGTIFDFSVVDYHAMAMLEAICHGKFEKHPNTASRPFDVKRAGFIPSHGAACMVLEDIDHAQARGATIHARLLGTAACSDANHLPNPSLDGQKRCLDLAFRDAGISPQEVDFISAHATSTPMGDRTEISAISEFFGEHANRLRINAPKSLLGHTCWSASVVEGVAAIEQMKAGRLHGSAHIEKLDPDIDLDVCADGPVDTQVGVLVNNSFGFGGINAISVFAHPEYAA